MRLHDMLMTETPRPYLGDPPLTSYADAMEQAVVIDATDVSRLLLSMTSFSDQVREDFEDFGSDPYAWQMAQFFNFDYTALSNLAPPFPAMLIEFDTREAVERHARDHGDPLDPMDTLKIGKSAVQVLSIEGEEFQEILRNKKAHGITKSTDNLERVANDPDLGWVLCLSPFHYVPGKGVVGPMCTYFIPVKKDGSPYLHKGVYPENENLPLWAIVSPAQGRDKYDDEERLPERSSAAQGWQAIVPALLTINFMHTPQGERGYHRRVEERPPNRVAKKFLAKHFRPMTSWYVLDISPLRQAVKEANGGTMPTTMQTLVKALHLVKGHYAHYPPNTYFGRPHEGWITVFRPAYRRGDIRAGRRDKQYRVLVEGQ